MEIETAPLSAFMVKIKRLAKIAGFVATVVFANFALGAGIYMWGLSHHKNPETVQLLSFVIPFGLTLFGLSSLLHSKWDIEQENRWRSS